MSKKRRHRRKSGFKSFVSVLTTISVAIILAYVIRTYVAIPVIISGDSMADTYVSGDVVLVTRFNYLSNGPERGDVVLCSVSGRDGSYVKRVTAIPGDTVKIEGGTLYINGAAAEESYVTRPYEENMDEITLGSDEYMVLGDNRADSYDSRQADIGLLHAKDFAGKVCMTIISHK